MLQVSQEKKTLMSIFMFSGEN